MVQRVREGRFRGMCRPVLVRSRLVREHGAIMSAAVPASSSIVAVARTASACRCAAVATKPSTRRCASRVAVSSERAKGVPWSASSAAAKRCAHLAVAQAAVTTRVRCRREHPIASTIARRTPTLIRTTAWITKAREEEGDGDGAEAVSVRVQCPNLEWTPLAAHRGAGLSGPRAGHQLRGAGVDACRPGVPGGGGPAPPHAPRKWRTSPAAARVPFSAYRQAREGERAALVRELYDGAAVHRRVFFTAVMRSRRRDLVKWAAAGSGDAPRRGVQAAASPGAGRGTPRRPWKAT